MADFSGDIYIKTPTNTTRYGQGEIKCDKSIVLKESTAPAIPAALYNKIYVDSLKRLRISDNIGNVRNVGCNYEQHIINTVINQTAAIPGFVIRTFILNGSNFNGVATKFSICYTSTSTTVNVRIAIATSPNAISDILLAPIGSNVIFSTNVFTNYPTTDTVVQLRASKNGAGTATLHSIKIEY